MIKRLIRLILGLLFILIGLIGFLLPFFPGWGFMIPGILLLAPHRGKRFACWLKKKCSRFF